jgi:hypothetical protein
MVKTSLNSAIRPKALHSIYIKIFINYLQLVTLMASFNLEWPDFVLDLFVVQEKAGTATEQLYNLDCYLSNNSGNDAGQ